ncbi:MAG: hypothetical protein WBX25_36510 [Rhodomicrobium sp.]
MGKKGHVAVGTSETLIRCNGSVYASSAAQTSPNALTALDANIKDSLEEIEILRGSVQYWESRRAPGDQKEREMLTEAFRIMHGELLGLTVRVRELRDRAEHDTAAKDE